MNMESSMFWEHESDAARRGTLTLNERLAILLKEYDALRQETQQSLALMPEIGKTVGRVIAGALIGASKASLGRKIALCAGPVIMAALGAVSHTHAKLEATSGRIMLIEDRVFQVTGASLLTHETVMNLHRKGRGGRRWLAASVIGIVLYLGLTIFLFRRFHDVIPSPTWIGLYWLPVCAAGAYVFFSAVRIGWQRKHIPGTRLLLFEEANVRDGRQIARSMTERGTSSRCFAPA